MAENSPILPLALSLLFPLSIDRVLPLTLIRILPLKFWIISLRILALRPLILVLVLVLKILFLLQSLFIFRHFMHKLLNLIKGASGVGTLLLLLHNSFWPSPRGGCNLLLRTDFLSRLRSLSIWWNLVFLERRLAESWLILSHVYRWLISLVSILVHLIIYVVYVLIVFLRRGWLSLVQLISMLGPRFSSYKALLCLSSWPRLVFSCLRFEHLYIIIEFNSSIILKILLFIVDIAKIIIGLVLLRIPVWVIFFERSTIPLRPLVGLKRDRLDRFYLLTHEIRTLATRTRNRINLKVQLILIIRHHLQVMSVPKFLFDWLLVIYWLTAG